MKLQIKINIKIQIQIQIQIQKGQSKPFRATGSSSEESISRPIQVFFNPNILIYLNQQQRFLPGRKGKHFSPPAPQVGWKRPKIGFTKTTGACGTEWAEICESVSHMCANLMSAINLHSILLSHGFFMARPRPSYSRINFSVQRLDLYITFWKHWDGSFIWLMSTLTTLVPRSLIWWTQLDPGVDYTVWGLPPFQRHTRCLLHIMYLYLCNFAYLCISIHVFESMWTIQCETCHHISVAPVAWVISCIFNCVFLYLYLCICVFVHFCIFVFWYRVSLKKGSLVIFISFLFERSRSWILPFHMWFGIRILSPFHLAA